MHPSTLVAAALFLAVPAAAQQAAPQQRDSAARLERDSASVRRAAGSYNCVRTVWAGHPGGSFRFQSQGYLTLSADGTYRFSASHLIGRYEAVAATRALRFTGGYFADKGPLDATYAAAGPAQVDLHFHERGGDTHWVCGSPGATPAATPGAPATTPGARATPGVGPVGGSGRPPGA